MAAQNTPADFDLSNAPASGDAVSQVTSDISQTASLGVSLVSLTRTLGGSWYNNAQVAKELKASLGPWAAEAFDEKRRLRQPSLDAKAFETHLDRHHGVFKMTEDCVATSGWAHLLHAFGIKPGMNIVRWKSRPLIRSNNKDVKLDMLGSVLCHIINLYEYCAFRTHVRQSKGTVLVTFEPSPEYGRGSIVEPFSNSDREFTAFERGTMWTSYLMCLEFHVFNSADSLPGHEADLPKRISALLKHQRLSGLVFDDFQPLLMDCTWLHEADRIRARALTNGGSDPSFFEAVCKDLLSTTASNEAPDHRRLRCESAFAVGKSQYFYFIYSCSHTFPEWAHAMRESAERVLKTYANYPSRSWKRQISECSEDVRDLLMVNPWVEIAERVRIVHLTASSPLWQALVKVE